MTSTPSTRRQLDAVAVWSITASSSQHGLVLAEKGLVHPTYWLIYAQVLGLPSRGHCRAALRSVVRRCSQVRQDGGHVWNCVEIKFRAPHAIDATELELTG